MSGYAAGADARYGALWQKGGSGAWVARHGLSSNDYQTAFDSYASQGYHLKHVNGYRVNGQTRYAAIWDKSATEYVARHGMTSSEYQREFDSLTARGFTLDRVSGY